MENTEAFKPNINRSFLTWWVLANIAALPALLLPYNLGMFLAMGVAIAADGASVGSVVYIIGFVILLLCGALIGGWFGLLQWLVLRKYISQAGKWIVASSIGLAIGTPLSWLAYGLLLNSPIVNRPSGIYFSNWYEYIAFGVILGLSVGVSQWFVLRQQAQRVGLWILALPICFTLGLAFTDPFLAPDLVDVMIQPLAERIAAQYPNELMNYDLLLIAIIDSIIALLGIGLVTGFLLDWLLRFHRGQMSADAVKGS
jgi:hypothetical protein